MINSGRLEGRLFAPLLVILAAIAGGALLGFVFANTNPGFETGIFAVALGIAPVVILMTLSRPEWGIVWLTLSFYGPWFSYTRLVLNPISYGVTAAFFGLLFVYITANRQIWLRARIRTFVHFAMLAWLLWGMVSALYGLVNHNSLSYVLSDLFQFAEFGISFWLVSLLITSWKQARFVLVGLLVNACFTSLFEIFLYITGRGSTLGADNSAIVQMTLDGQVLPRGLDFITPLIVPIVLSILLHAPVSKTMRRFLYVTLAATLLVVVLSFTRSVWFGIALASAAVLVLRWPFSWRPVLRLGAFAVVGLVLIALVSLLPAFQGRSLADLALRRIAYTETQLFSPTSQDQILRQIELQEAGGQILAAPLTGTGLGGTYFALSALGWGEKHFIHNTYFQIPLRTGIPGILIFLAVIGGFLRESWRIYRSVSDPFKKAIIVGVWAMMISTAVQSLTSAVWFQHPVSAVMGAAWAVVMAMKGSEGVPANELT